MALTICQNVKQVKRLFVKKLEILYSLGHQILIKFRQLVVNIIIKELQMVFFDFYSYQKQRKHERT